MIYFFILGRNPILSKAEIYSYLEKEKMSFKEIVFESNFLALEFEKEFKFDIQEFGGVIKAGKISFTGEEDEFLSYVEEDDLINDDRFSYSVFGNYDELEGLLKDKFKKERRKATIRHGRKSLHMQDSGAIELPNSEYCFFAVKLDKIYFGIVEHEYSHTDVRARDMKKPFRRESLAISPRLAKILINLSQVKKNELLLDCFCGVGGILQEALIKSINVYGIDKDKEAITQCKQNLKWLEKNFEINASYKLLNADSAQAPNIKVDGAASEPSLGVLIRKKLSDREAASFITNFEKKIIPVLRRIKNIKNPGAKIAMTFPYVREYSVNFQHIEQMTGLRVCSLNGIYFPIKESREKQFVSREIFVFI